MSKQRANLSGEDGNQVAPNGHEGIAAPVGVTALPGGGPSVLVPSWLDNLAAFSWRALVVAAVVVACWYLATLLWTVTASIAVAIVVAAVCAPYVLRLRGQGRTRNAAAAIVWVVAIAVIGGVLLLLVLAFLPHAADLVSSIEAGLEDLSAGLADLELPAWVGVMASDAVESVRESGGDVVGTIVAGAANAATILLLATFLLFFFLRDGDKAWLWAFGGLGERKREHITSAGDDALARVGGYLRGTTVLALIFAVSDYAFMFVLGVPLALTLALLAFVATFIPYFGSLVTTALIVLVTYGSLGTWPTVVMLGLLAIRGALVSYLVRPAIYGRTVNIHPALVLVVLPAGYALGGLVGLFAAVPVTAVVLAVARAAIEILEPEETPPLPDLVPAWLDRAAQWGWRSLVAIGLVALLVLILTNVPLVVIPVIVATIIAATLDPLVLALMRRGRSRSRASAIAVGGGTLAVVGVLFLAMASLVEQAGAIRDTTIAGAESATESLAGHLDLGVDAVAGGLDGAVNTIIALGDAVSDIVVIAALGTLLAFYFLRDGGRLWARVLERTRSEVAPQLSAAGSRAFDVLGGYMIGTGAISLAGAASQLVIMVVLDLPLALPVFVLSFFGGFIPYIGSFITTGIAFLITVAAGDPMDIVVMAIWTVVFNLVQGNVVAPLVYGRTVHLHPAVVLVAIPAGAAVAGILGIFVVVPALGVVAATWRTVLSVMGTPSVSAGGNLPLTGPASATEVTAGTAAPDPAPEPT